MIQAVTKYADVQTLGRPPRRAKGPTIYVPRADRNPQLLMDWYWKELRSGFLFHYLMREKATSRQRLRAVARQHYGRRANPNSDMRQLARVPAREYFRWRAVDEHFWEDDNNLRSFRRDNPDALISVDARQLPRSRFRKVYAEAKPACTC